MQCYVQKSRVEAVREKMGQYHRMLEMAYRLTAINLELMRGSRFAVAGYTRRDVV